ncbi:MAG: hypothetical protein MZV70_21165 [Desulfobacterales bacterium]|nr:hypothetical protein [Desulfobacterales bacterium]
MNVMMLSFALYFGFFTDLPAESVASISWPMARDGRRGDGLRRGALLPPGLAGSQPGGLQHGIPDHGGRPERLRLQHPQPAGRQHPPLLRHRLHADHPGSAGENPRAPRQGPGAGGAGGPALADARQGPHRR